MVIRNGQKNHKPIEWKLPPVKVRCFDCDLSFDEDTVEITGIESDDMGKDLESFICPVCRKEQKSHRRG